MTTFDILNMSGRIAHGEQLAREAAHGSAWSEGRAAAREERRARKAARRAARRGVPVQPPAKLEPVERPGNLLPLPESRSA